jgi:hypothetical protein
MSVRIGRGTTNELVVRRVDTLVVIEEAGGTSIPIYGKHLARLIAVLTAMQTLTARKAEKGRA